VTREPRFKGDQVVRDAVEILTQLAASSREAEESVLSAAFTALCINAGLSSSSNPQVALRLHQRGLLEKASIDNLEYGKCRIDFAWPVKRVGLRVNTWPRDRAHGSVIPEFVYTDAFLRERGWLIFPVDPASNTFDEQLDRAMSVIKRMGPYPRWAS
jgi:hypothetical protein